MIDEQAFAGSELSLSQVESGPDTIFHLGDRPLPIIASNAGRVTLKVPTDVNGLMDLTRQGAFNEQYGRIDVVGFTDSTFHPHTWFGNPLRWARTGPASFVALESVDGDVSEYGMVSGTVTPIFEGQWCCFRTPGLTPDPDALLFSMDSIEAWRMRPVREVVAKYPRFVGIQMIVMNDSVRVRTYVKAIDVSVGDGTGYSAFRSSFYDGFLSPRHDRVAFRTFPRIDADGVVIDPIPVIGESGDTAFTIDDVEFSTGVAFAPSGDTLYIAGYTGHSDHMTRVVAYEATTGAMLRSLDYPDLMPLDMTIDRTGRWLLVAMMTDFNGSRNGGGAHVLVVDRMTMTVAGHMKAPMDWSCGCDATIVDSDDGIFLAINSRDGGMVVFRFRALSDID